MKICTSRQLSQLLLIPMLLLTCFLLLHVTSFSLFAKASTTNHYANHNRITRLEVSSVTSSDSRSRNSAAAELVTLCTGGSTTTSLLEKKDNSTNAATSTPSYEYNSAMLISNANDKNMIEISRKNDATATIYDNNVVNNDDSDNIYENDNDGESKHKKLKVLFLSADTGGGHRASAESLANQFLKYHPNTEYQLADLWTPTNVYPYKTLVNSYKHLSAHPRQWRLLYYISNFKLYEKMADMHSFLTCYDKIEKQLEEYDPDIVISVHPTMNYIPEMAVRNIARKKGVYIPFFTVVTDFGSGHCTWFQGKPDMIYVASERIKKLAKRRGGHDDDKLVMSGLPIRDDFAVQVDKMGGDRTSVKGKSYRQLMKVELGLSPNKKTVLLMGGGEGVGLLATIAAKLREQLMNDGVDATILVICGRNEKLKNELNSRNWGKEQSAVLSEEKDEKKKKKRMRALKFIRTALTLGRKKNSQVSADTIATVKGNVDIIGLGFVTNMAEYMIAADVLVSKAGPGTIAEAASVGLPVMITSFLPGQEAGNVDIVLDGKFGAFSKKPKQIASMISSWLRNEELLDEMSRRSSEVGSPTAAREIVQDIVRQSLEKIEQVKL